VVFLGDHFIAERGMENLAGGVVDADRGCFRGLLAPLHGGGACGRGMDAGSSEVLPRLACGHLPNQW